MERRIVLVSGAPGAGKTTVARQLAPVLGLPLLSKDAIKESLWDSLDPPPGDREWSRLVGTAAMGLLWRLAEDAPGVVLEANFRPHNPSERASLRALGGSVVEVYCWCPPALAAERYATRALSPSHHRAHVSPTLDPELLAEFDAPMAIGTVVRVDTTGPVEISELAAAVTACWSD